jgi:hypothetical protein
LFDHARLHAVPSNPAIWKMAPMTQAVIALGHSSKLHNSPDSCHMIFVNVTDVRGDIVIEPD